MLGAQQTHQWTLMHTDLTSHVTLGKILNLRSLYISWRYNCWNFIALLLGINETIYMKALTYFLTCCEHRMLLEILINYIIITLFFSNIDLKFFLSWTILANGQCLLKKMSIFLCVYGILAVFMKAEVIILHLLYTYLQLFIISLIGNMKHPFHKVFLILLDTFASRDM